MDKRLTPYVHYAMHDLINHPFNIDRSIWDYELIYIEDGYMQVNIEGRDYLAKKDDIIFLVPRKHHVLRDYHEGSVSQPHVHFDLFEDDKSQKIGVSFKRIEAMNEYEKSLFRKDDLKELGLDFPPIISIRNHQNVKKLLFELIDEYRLNRKMRKEKMASLLIAIIIEISRGIEISKFGQDGRFYKLFNDLESFILNNYKNNPTLEQLCKISGLSKFHFMKIFKSHYGMSPHQYIKRIRLEAIKNHLLQNKKIKLKELAKEYHFKSPEAFSRFVKDNLEINPKDIRRSAR